MKKISLEEFKTLLAEDKDFASRLKEYLHGETDVNIVGEKSIEFARQEGYEIEVPQSELSMDELESVSGGKVSGKDIGTGAAIVGGAVLFGVVCVAT